jgi:excisionase family DNA binding protein
MSAFDDLPAVLTVEEAARALRIGRTTAYEAVRTGAIPSVRIGRTLRISRHALEAMLAQAGDDQR